MMKDEDGKERFEAHQAMVKEKDEEAFRQALSAQPAAQEERAMEVEPPASSSVREVEPPASSSVRDVEPPAGGSV